MAAQNTSSTNTGPLLKGMIKDIDDSYIPQGAWYHARNISPYSRDGNQGAISNEPSNLKCLTPQLKYTIIGCIYLYKEKWAIFSTDNDGITTTPHSEIGVFDEETCVYEPLKNCKGQYMDTTNCLDFKLSNLIIGVSKENADCTFQVYWADGVNPDRTLNIDKPEFAEICQDENTPPVTLPGPPGYSAVGCITCDCTTQIDCDKIRLAPLVTVPCMTLTRGTNAGSIPNGSFYVIAAYVIGTQRVTDYFMPSNIQSIFVHNNEAGSLKVTIDQMETKYFDYFELVVVRTINSQTTAKKVGIYSTRQNEIFLDKINEALPTVPIEYIPVRTPSYEKSNGIFQISNYMLRVGPTAKFDFNYQPLANQIVTKWQAVAYPSDYYSKSGNNTGYLRDEVYSFFIRWVYNTGEKSSSYHIPGRPAYRDTAPSMVNPPAERNINTGILFPGSGPNALELTDPVIPYTPGYWEVNNTGVTTNPSINTVQSDGGILIAEGYMGYWQSSERYPNTKHDIYDSSAHPWSTVTTQNTPYKPLKPGVVTLPSDYDLCGEPIRHHKFPDNETIPHFRTKPGLSSPNNPITGIPEPQDTEVIVLGVAFENVLPPVDNQGNLIPGIVGYEILRGSREGNKSIVAKGIINNMRQYKLTNTPNTITTQTGLYPNYPYNFGFRDQLLTPQENLGENPLYKDRGPLPPAASPIALTREDIFTFHSPETSYNNPFLSSKEIKLYGEVYGNVMGKFDESPGHPKHKLMTDLSLVVAAIIGTSWAAKVVRGETLSVYKPPYINKNGNGLFAGVAGSWGINDPIGTGILAGLQAAAQGNYAAADALYSQANSLANIIVEVPGAPGIDALVKQSLYGVLAPYNTIYPLNAATIDPGTTREQKTSDHDYLDPVFKVVQGFTLFSNYWAEGTQSILDLMISMVPFTQYAMRYTSHGFSNLYDVGTDKKTTATIRYRLSNITYLNEGFQQFGSKSEFKINNLYRSRTVALQTDRTNVQFPTARITDPYTGTVMYDNTVQSIGSSRALRPVKADKKRSKWDPKNIKSDFPTVTASHYAGLKYRIRNQYGQLNGIIQVPVSICPVNPTATLVPGTPIQPTTGTLFNGDIYIGRHTEKNSFFYFWDWLHTQPDGYEFNYQLRYNMNFPRYWANFEKYDASDFLRGIKNWVTSLFTSPLDLPSARHSLDGPLVAWGGGFAGILNLFASLLVVRNRYFYTFYSGVRDFYVESEINVDLRDWEEPIEKRHYDPYRYTDLRTLFDVPYIKSGNFFKYDESLSVSRVMNNFFSWANLQLPDYDPLVAETCYTYYPNRIIYSMPQEDDVKKDFWRVFLANNYKDFISRVTAVKSINMNGAMILFETESPGIFIGEDTLQSSQGVEITVGDGGLFNRDAKKLVNSDASYQYASCQSRLSVINTKYGLFWISQEQGKIFNYVSGLSEISLENMSFWLAEYLPYRLTRDFPNYDLVDNPVFGIGCQSIYDNREDMVYFCKKDYQLKPQYIGQMTYTPGTGFLLNNTAITLGDPVYFDNASWTLSYNPKLKAWTSFHDWHPDLSIEGKNGFLTTVHDSNTYLGTIWRHNERRDNFCNFYGVDYPFEIDRIAQTGPIVNALRSVEYFMEAYIYKQPNNDIYEVLDANFDHATIYNREQVSGTLILNQMPKNSVAQRLLFPKINPTSIDILADKVEQKYRFNQFWDITADRGEFTFPNVQRPIWITQPNGYIRDLNPANLNYQKNSFERKKFRHYANHIRLYKNISNDINFVIKLINAKELVSMR